jgi:hypothetical protein
MATTPEMHRLHGPVFMLLLYNAQVLKVLRECSITVAQMVNIRCSKHDSLKQPSN